MSESEVERMGRVVRAQEAVLKSLGESEDIHTLARLPTMTRFVSLLRDRYERAKGRLETK